MLAGYLPFDDDPGNPEGSNINLLYKYIVTTSLTFPEYVTPHARDILRRILVPNPRKRADLFEVARHSWLNDYAHALAFITSDSSDNVEASPMILPVGKLPSELFRCHSLTHLQKSLVSLRPFSLAVPRSAKPSSHQLCHLAGSPIPALPSSKSVSRHHETRSGERCSSNMLHHNWRLRAAPRVVLHNHLRRQHRRMQRRQRQGQGQRAATSIALSLLRRKNRRGPPGIPPKNRSRQQRPSHLGSRVQSQTLRRLCSPNSLYLSNNARRHRAPWAGQTGCLRVATLTLGLWQLPSLLPTPKPSFRNLHMCPVGLRRIRRVKIRLPVDH